MEKLSNNFSKADWKIVLRKGYKPKTVHSVRERTEEGRRAENSSFSHRMYSLRLLST